MYGEGDDDGGAGDGRSGDVGHTEPDSLTRASFVIPCAAPAEDNRHEALAGRATDATYFASLKRFERTQRPCVARQGAYEQQVRYLSQVLERACKQIFAHLLDDIRAHLSSRPSMTEQQYFVPGTAGNDAPEMHLRAIALLGPPICPSQLHSSLHQLVARHPDCTCLVTLSSRECTSLAVALRLVTARAQAAQSPMGNTASNGTEQNARPNMKLRVVVRLQGVERIPATILNDIIQALHSLNQQSNDLSFALLLDAESGSRALDDNLFPDTLPLLDLRRSMVCQSSVQAFEIFLQELLLHDGASGEPPLMSPGSMTLSCLNRLYFERRSSLEDVVEAAELAVYHHFATRPETSVCNQSHGPPLSHENFTGDYFDWIRDQLCGEEKEMAGSLARMEAHCKGDKTMALQQLQRALQEDNAALAEVQRALQSSSEQSNRFRAQVRLVHAIRAWLSGPTGGSTSNLPSSSAGFDTQHFTAPRSSELGGIAYALSTGRSVRSTMHDLHVTLRRRTLTGIEDLWEQLQLVDLLRLSKKHVIATEVFERVMDQALSSGDDDDDNDADADAVGKNGEPKGAEQRRLERVQRHLQREESASALKKEVAEALFACLEDLAPKKTRLEKSISVYDNVEVLNSMLDPAPRANVLAALNGAPAYGEKIGKGMVTPDICRAFETYSDAGRLVNLADWHAAFEQSLQASSGRGGYVNESAARPGKRRRRRQGSAATSDDDKGNSDDGNVDAGSKDENGPSSTAATAVDEAKWREPDMVQVRFALAVHELGRMGFLKRTRRKADHVLKLVHDLPPAKSSARR